MKLPRFDRAQLIEGRVPIRDRDCRIRCILSGLVGFVRQLFEDRGQGNGIQQVPEGGEGLLPGLLRGRGLPRRGSSGLRLLLLRRGLRRECLANGSELIVDGYQAKDHSLKRANGRDVTFSDGRKFFLGSSGTGAPTDGAEQRGLQADGGRC